MRHIVPRAITVGMAKLRTTVKTKTANPLIALWPAWNGRPHLFHFMRLYKKIIISLLITALCFLLQFQGHSQDSRIAFDKAIPVSVEAELRDADTGEAIQYASVYLVHKGDTTITHFTLSDSTGVAILPGVLKDGYTIYAEMTGYEPYAKRFEIHPSVYNAYSLGVIKMKPSAELLNAASVSAAASPITIKQDTVIYNAAAYAVGSDDKLANLLAKMPGINVSGGTISYHGTEVRRITIGGRTFFVDNPSVALTIPAKIVENVKIFEDADDDVTHGSIVSQADKKPVMDVGLKKEYQNGFFGNASASAGLEAGNGDFVYNGNLFASSFSPKEQLTLVANANNYNDPLDPSLVVVRGGGVIEDSKVMGTGINTSAQAGINLNTDRVKGFTTDFNANYNYAKKEIADTTHRDSFTSTEDIVSDELLAGYKTSHEVTTNLRFSNKNKKKYIFSTHVRGTFLDGKEQNSGHTESYSGSTYSSLQNSHAGREARGVRGSIASNFSKRNFSKKGRTLGLVVTGGSGYTTGSGYDRVDVDYGSGNYLQNLLFDTRQHTTSLSGRVEYTEPLSSLWTVQFSARAINSFTDNKKDANEDYYTVHSSTSLTDITEKALLQYAKNKSKLLFGFSADEIKNKTNSSKYGVQGDEWQLKVAPSVEYSLRKPGRIFSVTYGAMANNPMVSQMYPGLDFSDPLQVRIGNDALKSSFNHSFRLRFSGNNKKTNRSLSAFANAGITSNRIIDAVWFDSKGMRYVVPVNSPSPSSNSHLSLSYSTPIDKQQHFYAKINTALGHSITHTYQAKGRLDVIDADTFDYQEFMMWFTSTDNLTDSRTRQLSSIVDASLKYGDEFLSVDSGVSLNYRNNNYSFNHEANLNTWQNRLFAEVLYKAPMSFEFQSIAEYLFYKGFAEGMNKPQLIWNLKAAKGFKYFTLHASAIDILSQQRALIKQVSSSYALTKASTIRGSIFLVGISFDFGKMNASKNIKAQSAMRDIIMM